MHNARRLRSAAIREFARHGLQGAKVSSIVAAANLTQPSFYRTWPSKQAAYEEIVRDTLEAWHDTAEHILDGPPELPLGERVRAGLTRLYSRLTDDIELTRLVFQASDNDPRRYLPFAERYELAFRRLQEQRLITTRCSAETLAQAYIALTERFFHIRLYEARHPLTETVREVADLLTIILRRENESCPEPL